MKPLRVERLGTLPYGEGLELQERLVGARRAGEIPDTLLLLEHPHVVTLGTGSHSDHVLLDEAERRLLGIELYETGRGGDVTYHGPGQLVGYPILDLKPDRKDLHRYVRDIEEALIRALADFGLEAGRIEGLTGVWLGGGARGGAGGGADAGADADAGAEGAAGSEPAEKVAAIGVRVSSGWITSHGFALNVSTDLRFFESIVPCGIRDHGVTSMARALGEDVSVAAVADVVVGRFAEVFGREVEEV